MASPGKIGAFLAEPRNVVAAGIRRDGRPHPSPNWFLLGRGAVLCVDDARPGEVRDLPPDPRAQLLADDSVGFRAVLVPATAQIREDIAAGLPRFRAIGGFILRIDLWLVRGGG